MNINIDPLKLITKQQKEELSAIAFEKVKAQLEAIEIKPINLEISKHDLDVLTDNLNEAFHSIDYSNVTKLMVKNLEDSLK